MSSNQATAAPQAGVLAGENPLAYSTTDPLPLFVIQVVIIIGFCRLVSIPLARIRQPAVIAEVLGGIILGPSVMGRIPNFQATLFPTQSLLLINLMANLGLVLFLFLVGLEIDPKLIRQDARKSLSIAVCGMVLPFALGVAVSYALYNFDGKKSVPFGSFLLFLGVAMSITAFPVLARILAELKLLNTNVGAITISAGLLNDCTAWVLLALVVALLNASSTLTALWVFLCAVAWGLFIIFIVGPLFKRLCIITGSFEEGPPPIVMAVLLMMVLLSAFVTDIIGVHPIFGGFLVGVVVPHDGGFALLVTEKIEDLVNIVFLPLYFALSGLKTQIGLLDTGEVWGFVFLTIFVACFGKVVGCAAAAKIGGMSLRESMTVGFLMNCKGLVELIVLNLGHDAGVISDTIFVIMIVMALFTTCMTSPIVIWLYPPTHQNKLEKVKTRQTDIESTDRSLERQPGTGAFRLMLSLNNVQHIPSIMALIQMLQHEPKFVKSDTAAGHGSEEFSTSPLEIHALRLIELTQRTSAVMRMQESQNTINRDPVVSVIRTFARLNHIGVKAHLAVSATEDFAKNLTEQASVTKADMIILPWGDHIAHQEGMNPLEPWLMQKDANVYNPHHAHFVLKVFSGAICPVGLFFDRGFGVGQTDFNNIVSDENDLFGAEIHHPAGMTEQHILVPFFGGIDDREAVRFALKLSSFPGVSVTVLRLVRSVDEAEEKKPPIAVEEGPTLPNDPQVTLHSLEIPGSSSPVPGSQHRPALDSRTPSWHNRQSHLSAEEVATPTLTMTSNELERLHSQVADNALIRLLTQQSIEAPSLIEETNLTEQQQNDYFGNVTIPATKKVHFAELRTSHPLQDATAYAREHLKKKDLLIVGRRKVGGLWSFKEEITRIFEKHVGPAEPQEHEQAPKAGSLHAGQGEMRKVLGDVAQGMSVAGVTASLLVVQAKLEVGRVVT